MTFLSRGPSCWQRHVGRASGKVTAVEDINAAPSSGSPLPSSSPVLPPPLGPRRLAAAKDAALGRRSCRASSRQASAWTRSMARGSATAAVGVDVERRITEPVVADATFSFSRVPSARHARSCSADQCLPTRSCSTSKAANNPVAVLENGSAIARAYEVGQIWRLRRPRRSCSSEVAAALHDQGPDGSTRGAACPTSSGRPASLVWQGWRRSPTAPTSAPPPADAPGWTMNVGNGGKYRAGDYFPEMRHGRRATPASRRLRPETRRGRGAVGGRPLHGDMAQFNQGRRWRLPSPARASFAYAQPFSGAGIGSCAFTTGREVLPGTRTFTIASHRRRTSRTARSSSSDPSLGRRVLRGGERDVVHRAGRFHSVHVQ